MRSRTAVELLKATSDIEMHLDKVSSPLLILHGEADTVTDPLVSQLLYEKASSKDKTLKLYEDAYHCILQGEPDDTIFTVLVDIVTWHDSRCFRTNVISNPPMLQLIHFCISLQHYDTVPVLELNLVEDDNITSYSFKVRTSRPPKFHSNSESSVLNFFLNSTMELSQSLRFQQLELPFCPQQLQQPQKPTFSVRRTSQVIVAAAKTKRRPPIEGVSEELNLIADQSLDFAPARRRVRSAFVELQQQLDHCLFKLAPSGIRTEEWYEINSRGIGIFCKSWKPREDVPIKGVLCFCHGYGDTCVFFFEGIAKQIAAAGYAVYAMDYPGFGLSEGLHGFISSFDQLADDVIEQYTKIKAKPELKGLPHFILGQSMGGAVTLKVHFKQPYVWDGIVLVAPMCKIAEDVTPPPAAEKILTLMSRVVPKAKLVPQKDLAELAFRDERKRKLAVYNVTCYNGPVRLKTAVELLNATKEIEMQVDKVSSPLLFFMELQIR
ncbi:hypothetical protein ACLB2K_042695 [Fragaria x ananassa]